MYYDKIFLRRDLKSFLSEMIYSKNNAFVIQFDNFEQLKNYAQLIPMQFFMMKNKGEGIKHILYCFENMQKNSDGSFSISGKMAKLNGGKLEGCDSFICEFSDYDIKISTSLINWNDVPSQWRRNIYLHLDEQKQKEYKQNCANKFFDDKEFNI